MIRDIVVDFDGTCVRHEYPHIGAEIGAVPVLHKLVEHGYNLILFTMRSGKELDDAVRWFKINDIELYGIQVNPTQAQWTDSPKAYGQLYIDDAALGVPLKRPWDRSVEFQWMSKPYVDWRAVDKLLTEMGLFEND